MTNRLLWWVLGPASLVAGVAVLHWQYAGKYQVPSMPVVSIGAVPLKAPPPKKEFVLEVIALGVTLDKYRQGALWSALQSGNAQTTIRDMDKEKTPWRAQDKSGQSGGRGGHSLDNGVQYTPMYFGVPVFNAEPPINNHLRDKPNKPMSGLVGSASTSGYPWHLFSIASRRFAENPDGILEDVFAFFDAYPDVPYVILNSDDSIASRHHYRPKGSPPLLRDGRYVLEMPDSSSLFVLARRERVDAVRPFAFEDVSPEASVDDLNRNGVARRLFLAYAKLSQTVPHPDREEDPASLAERAPLVSEWLPVAAQFARRPDLHGTNMLDALRPSLRHIPENWKPTPWFPIPWNKEQLAEFDKLPTLGYIHRPTYVKFIDAESNSIKGIAARTKILQAGFDEALLTLPAAERNKSPALIIAATGGDTEQLVALHSVMRQRASGSGPEIDSNRLDQFIHTDKRLGNTGAATLFMQMAIGVMGSYRTGGISAAINMRDKDEATIVFISPPSEEKRARQTHPTGTPDVFAHHGTPMIDPANYEQ